MTVRFVGAGPGAPDLITVRGLRALATSPVCLYAGSLVPEELLGQCPPGAHRVDTARMTLDEITAELVAAHEAGHDVARLCSGDPSVFSAVAEQTRRARRRRRAVGDRPGRPGLRRRGGRAADRADRPRRRPVRGSHPRRRQRHADAARRVARRVGRRRRDARAAPGRAALRLGGGSAPEAPPGLEPVAVVARASRDDEVVLRGTLADIAEKVAAADVRRTAVIVVGAVVGTSGGDESHLYSAARARP